MGKSVRSDGRLQRLHVHRAAASSLAPILFLGFVLAACGSSTSNAQPTAATQVKVSPFRIEYIGDLTGTDAEQNAPEAAGLKAWAQAVNSTGGIGGHNVVLSFCDATSTVTGATSCAGRVASNVGVVIEEGVAGELKAGPPIINSRQKIVLTDVPTANPSKGSNLFQVSQPIGADIAADLALAKKNNITSVGVITTSDATGVAVTKSFSTAAPKFGIKVTTVYLAPGSVDASVQISQLKQAHVQMLYVGTLGEPAIATLEATHTLGWTAPIFVLPADVTQTFIGATHASLPSALYGQPPSSFQLPAVLTGSDLTKFQQLESQYKKASGTAWNIQTQSPITAFLGSLAGAILQKLGPQPDLKSAEAFLTSGTIDAPLGSIAFLATMPFQDGNLPAPVATATPTPLEWQPCKSTSQFTC